MNIKELIQVLVGMFVLMSLTNIIISEISPTFSFIEALIPLTIIIVIVWLLKEVLN